MLLREAEWLGRYLSAQNTDQLGTVINLGSSTAAFRKVRQPFVEERVFAPLLGRGVPVIHSDLKDEDGETLSANILEQEGLQRLQAIGARTILCCNMLEHVPCVRTMATQIRRLTPPGGLLILTVPNSYPYHCDPTDNLFRPDIQGLYSLFPEFDLREAVVLEAQRLIDDLRQNPWLVPRHLLRSICPVPGMRKWLSALDRWRWLLRPYKVTCIVLKHPQ